LSGKAQRLSDSCHANGVGNNIRAIFFAGDMFSRKQTIAQPVGELVQRVDKLFYWLQWPIESGSMNEK